MNNQQIYDQTVAVLNQSFGSEEAKTLFLNGGCYWIAQFLHRRMNNSCLVINREQEHCALEFGNHVYDITGRVCPKDYVKASDRDLSYMEKYYHPSFDTKKMTDYLNGRLK